MRPPLKRFLEKVSPCPITGCWWWTCGVDKDGYGKFWRGGETIRASRAAWEIFRGPIPDGLHALHRCDSPGCANPEHLFLGTPRDNTLDMWAKGRGDLHPPESVGEKNGRAVLGAEEVKEICRRYTTGDVTMKALGAAYGVSKHTVFDIVHGRSWRSLLASQLSAHELVPRE